MDLKHEKDLKYEMIKHSARADSIVRGAEQDNRDLTESETAEIDDINLRAYQIDEELAVLNPSYTRQLGRRTQPNTPGEAPMLAGNRHTDEMQNLRRLQREPYQARDFNTLFAAELKSGIPRNTWQSFGELVQTVAENRYDPRLIRMSGMGENSGSDGGFMVPVQYGQLLLDDALLHEIVRPRAVVSPMVSNVKQLAGFDYLNGAPFDMEWVGDGGTFSEQKGKVIPLNLIAKKAGILCRASNSLTDDAPEFNSMLFSAFSKSMAYGLDEVFFNGTGAGTPLGIFNCNSIITIAKEGSQTADTVVYSNIVKMFAALHPACYGDSIWVCSPSVLPQLLTMVVSAANATTVNVAIMGSNGQLSLLSRPLLVSPHLKVVGDLGDLLLFSPSQYIIGMRKDLSITTSPHAYFTSDELAVRIITRCDGRPAWDRSFTASDGGKLSWAVTLAERA